MIFDYGVDYESARGVSAYGFCLFVLLVDLNFRVSGYSLWGVVIAQGWSFRG